MIGSGLCLLILLLSVSCAILFVAASDIAPHGHTPPPTCTFIDYTSGTSYDLRPLMSSKGYIFRQKLSKSDRYAFAHRGEQYEYHVNVCNDVMIKPDACTEKDEGPAFQITVPDDPTVEANAADKRSAGRNPPPPPQYKPQCYRLGTLSTMKFSLLDPEIPSKGVRLVYELGEDCLKKNTPEVIKATNITWVPNPRQISLDMTCDPDLGTTPGAEISDLMMIGAQSFVTEKPPPNECQYIIHWRSKYACPVQTSSMSTAIIKVIFIVIIFLIIAGALMVLSDIRMAKQRWWELQNGHIRSKSELLATLLNDFYVKYFSGHVGMPLRSPNKTVKGDV